MVRVNHLVTRHRHWTSRRRIKNYFINQRFHGIMFDEHVIHYKLALVRYNLSRDYAAAVRAMAGRIVRNPRIPRMNLVETDDETVDDWEDEAGERHRNSRRHADSPTREVSFVFVTHI